MFRVTQSHLPQQTLEQLLEELLELLEQVLEELLEELRFPQVETHLNKSLIHRQLLASPACSPSGPEHCWTLPPLPVGFQWADKFGWGWNSS